MPSIPKCIEGLVLIEISTPKSAKVLIRPNLWVSTAPGHGPLVRAIPLSGTFLKETNTPPVGLRRPEHGDTGSELENGWSTSPFPRHGPLEDDRRVSPVHRMLPTRHSPSAASQPGPVDETRSFAATGCRHPRNRQSHPGSRPQPFVSGLDSSHVPDRCHHASSPQPEQISPRHDLQKQKPIAVRRPAIQSIPAGSQRSKEPIVQRTRSWFDAQSSHLPVLRPFSATFSGLVLSRPITFKERDEKGGRIARELAPIQEPLSLTPVLQPYTMQNYGSDIRIFTVVGQPSPWSFG